SVIRALRSSGRHGAVTWFPPQPPQRAYLFASERMGRPLQISSPTESAPCSTQTRQPLAIGVGRRFLIFRYQTAPGCVVPADGVAYSLPSRSSMGPARLCRAMTTPTWFGRAPLHAAAISRCVLPVARARTWSPKLDEPRLRPAGLAALVRVRPRDCAGAVGFAGVAGTVAEALFLGPAPLL